MAIFERALLVEELGRRRGVVVDRRARLVLPLRHAEARMVGVVDLRAREARHVADAVFAFVLEAHRAHGLVVRHPVPERRLQRRAAELIGLFEEEYLVAVPDREAGGRQTDAAAADDHDVEFGIEGFRLRRRGRLTSDSGQSIPPPPFLPAFPPTPPRRRPRMQAMCSDFEQMCDFRTIYRAGTRMMRNEYKMHLEPCIYYLCA